MKVSWDYGIPNIWKQIMFQTTNQIKLSLKFPHMCATVTFSGILIRRSAAISVLLSNGLL